jgi:hypothetical protein
MTLRKLGLWLLLGVASATLLVQPIFAQPNPGPDPKSAEANELVILTLSHADAEGVAQVLANLNAPPGVTPGPRGRIGAISISVDQRINSIIVSAPSGKVAEIKALVTKLDVPQKSRSQPTVRVFPLRFAEPDKSLEAALELAIGRPGQFTIDRLRKQVIVSTNDDALLKQVQELLARLDIATSERSSGDVQVRIVWLVQGRGEEFAAPPEDLKDVLPALAKLGIEKPRLAANTMVNASPNSQFRVDGIANVGETVHLSVTGQFVDRADPASLHISIKANGNNGEICNLSTDISAPMGHLVVLGVTPTRETTSVFVVQVTRK